MDNRKYCFRTLFLLFSLLIFASANSRVSAGNVAASATEGEKRALTIDDVYEWKRITHNVISDNGQWVAVTLEKWRGDGDRDGRVADYAGDAYTTIYDAKGNVAKTFCPIKGFTFSASSAYAVVATKETEASRNARALKEQNKKKGEAKDKNAKADAPMDTLWVYRLGGDCEQIDSLRNYKVAASADWLAYQRGKSDSTLYVRTLDNKQTMEFANVKEYGFARKGAVLYYTTEEGKKPATTTLYAVNLSKPGSSQLVSTTTGRIEKIALSEDGLQLAYLFSNAQKDAAKTSGFSLWYAKTDGVSKAELLSDSINAAFTSGWEISGNMAPRFSKAGDILLFGVAPIEREKDTLVLKSQRPEVQVWNWNEPVQYTVQDHNKGRDARRTYESVVLLANGKVVQIANEDFDHVSSSPEMKGTQVILSNSKPYSVSSMWEGRTRADYKVMDIFTGECRELSNADYASYRISPSGKYAYGYSDRDSCWFTVDMSTLQKFVVTTPSSLVAWDEDNDVPDYPGAYGLAGWLEGEEALLIYDRYDIWKVPARGGELVNLTKNGREQKLQYRLMQLDTEKRNEPVSASAVQYLKVFNEQTKGSAIYRTTFKKPAAPVFVMGGDYQLSTPVKAKNAEKVIFTKETFSVAPEVYLSDMKFKAPVKLTDMARQQEQFLWGSAQLISWTSYKGIELEGVLYLPENFDASKKYPMIVNFYERNAETLYSYRVPQPHRSTPDYHTYLSNGYVVFNPDVRYTDGHPGESCYDCVMSGVDKVLSLGFVDEKRIGASGHSWGGYQLAYLATRTNRFAAIESGAPVVNMFSAYGGIRWGSGLARSFQYEHTQSRIGASPWEAPELYKENSALFTMDKVETPILIMHNDTDGHVPWYQGIEYFVAMKRLGKPCWLLNYTGEPHWPVKMANRFDFQRRLMQFFDHFLKDAPMPAWMSEGVKAVDQPYELGY